MRCRIAAIALFLLLFVTALPSFGAADAASALAGLDEEVTAMMSEWKVPGLGLVVIRDGDVLLLRGYGYRDLEEGKPVTERTLFAIGSNSKSFTATLLGLLVDEGRLDWDVPVRQYLPDFQLHDPVATAQMTARDLLTHRSGLPRHDVVWYGTGLTRRELYERLRYLEPSRPFRSLFQYQNLMFMTAGYLAQALTDQSWEDLVEQRIFAPLGMERSGFSVLTMQQDDDFALPYLEADEEVRRVPFRNIDEIGPAGSINSSVEEMARYVKFHLDLGKVGESELLSEASARQMQSPQMVLGGPIAARFNSDPELGDPSYGLGLIISSYRGHRHVYHGGGIDGFISGMEWLPDDRIGVVVLTNYSGTNPLPSLVARTIYDRLLGLEPIDWVGRTRERLAEAEVKAEEAKAKRGEERKESTSPSHALADYAASYEHPGYGRAEVRLVDGVLELAATGFTAPLEHYHYDIFTVPENLPPPVDRLAGTLVTFSYDKKGDIDRLAIPLEPSVDDILFVRVEPE